MKLIRKPLTVEAHQFHSTSPELPNGVCKCAARHEHHVHTGRGVLVIREGEWVVTNIKGERFPITDEIRLLEYDEAEDQN